MNTSSRRRTRPPSRTKLAAAVAAGAILAWQVVATSLAAGQEDQTSDFSASSYAAQSEVAAITASNQRLDEGDPAGAAVMAKRALTITPISAAGLRDLGLAADAFGRSAEAVGIFSQAAALGWRDRPTQIWLADAYLRDKNHDAAAERIDAAMRTEPYSASLYGVIDQMIADRGFAHALATRLAFDPKWRPLYLRFTNDLPIATLEARRTLIEDLARTSSPPTRGEIAPLVVALARQGRQGEARTLWFAAQRLSESAVYDPDFALVGATGEVPFAWTALPVFGAHVETGDSPSAGSDGLRISADASAAGTILRQQVALPPGHHMLSYSPAPSGPAGGTFGWSVRCSDSRQYLLDGLTLSQHPPYDFDVPAGCPYQLVELRIANGAAAARSTVLKRLDLR